MNERRGQVTMFIIVGLVFIITIIVLYFVVRASRPEEPKPEPTVDTAYAQTCLQKATEVAFAGLANDGLLVQTEGYPVLELEPEQLPPLYVRKDDREVVDDDVDDEDLPYKVESIRDRFPLGIPNYFGLCEPRADTSYSWNRLGDYTDVNGRYSCGMKAYDYILYNDFLGTEMDIPSIQEQLADAITIHMQECMADSEEDITAGEGKAEVIIQQGAVLVRWSTEQLSHTDERDLNLAWTAIAEMVTREVTERTYTPFIDPLQCKNCDLVTITDTEHEQSGEQPYDTYEIRVGDRIITHISFENRDIKYWNEETDEIYELEPYTEEEWQDWIAGAPGAIPPEQLDECDPNDPENKHYDQSEDTCVYRFWLFDEDKLSEPELRHALPGADKECQWIDTCDGTTYSEQDCYATYALADQPDNEELRELKFSRGCLADTTLGLSMTDEGGLGQTNFSVVIPKVEWTPTSCTEETNPIGEDCASDIGWCEDYYGDSDWGCVNSPSPHCERQKVGVLKCEVIS